MTNLYGEGITPAPKFNLIRTQRYLSRDAVDGNAGSTYHATWSVEGDFDWVRIIHHSTKTSAYTALRSIVAASSTPNLASWIPLAADGVSNGTWVTTTYNSAGADSDPPSVSGPTQTVDIPASAGTDRNAYAMSDWMQVSSLPNPDGSPVRYLMTRIYSANVQPVNSGMNNFVTGYNGLYDRGRPINLRARSGDFVTVNQYSAWSPAVTANTMAAHAIQYVSRARGVTLSSFGDSIAQGASSASGYHSYGLEAANILSRLRAPVSFASGGWGGQTMDQILARLIIDLPVLRPDIVSVPVMSPNDGAPSSANPDVQFSKAMLMANRIIAAGAVPILVSPLPWRYSGQDEVLRQGIRDRCRTLSASGSFLVFDVDAAVGDPSNPGFQRPGYWTPPSDAHPNQASNLQLGAAFAPVVARAMGIRGVEVRA